MTGDRGKRTLNLPATSCGESPTVKKIFIFYSLANPAASSGECARCSVQIFMASYQNITYNLKRKGL